MSQDEWGGRNVLDFVRRVLADRPGEAAAVAGRLEKELQQLLIERKKRPPRRRSRGQGGVVETVAPSGRGMLAAQ